MSSAITIRNIDPELKRQLRIRAATLGRSMEEEARSILRAELSSGEADATNLYERIRRHVDPLGGIDLPDLDRESIRKPPELEP